MHRHNVQTHNFNRKLLCSRGCGTDSTFGEDLKPPSLDSTLGSRGGSFHSHIVPLTTVGYSTFLLSTPHFRPNGTPVNDFNRYGRTLRYENFRTGKAHVLEVCRCDVSRFADCARAFCRQHRKIQYIQSARVQAPGRE